MCLLPYSDGLQPAMASNQITVSLESVMSRQLRTENLRLTTGLSGGRVDAPESRAHYRGPLSTPDRCIVCG